MAITKVTTDVITDSAVTAPKLAADSVITAKIADNAVTAAKIAAGALTDQVAGISSAADATAITIDSSERVGIGVTSPSRLLHIAEASGSTILELQRTNTNTTGAAGVIQVTASDDHAIAAIAVFGDGDNEGGEISFRTTSAASENNYYNSTTEAMRISICSL